jgi:site-specific DNA recombinase
VNNDYFQKLANSLNTELVSSSNKAVIYTRVSTKEQADNNASLQTQKKYCQEFAKKKGLMVMAYFGGTFESAKSDERKEFQRMLSHVKRNKKIDTIIVYSYDRFSRTGPNGAYISQQLLKNGVKTLSATQEVDPLSPSGNFQQNLYYIFSQFDNELRKDKSVTGMKERLRQGYWLYKPPIGYSNIQKGNKCDKHEFLINNDGKLIKRAFMWKLQYVRNFEICNRLNIAGLKIHPKRLNRILQNPFYCGKIINKLIPGEVVDGKHPKIISEKNWLRVQDIIDNKYRTQTKNTYFEEIPLKVFMKCHKTNDPLTGYIVKKKGIWYYKSRSKGTKLNVNAKKLNLLFADYLKQFELKKELDKPFKQLVEYAFTKYQSNNKFDTQNLESKNQQIKVNFQKLEERYAIGEIDSDLYQKYAKKYSNEMSEIDKKLSNDLKVSSNLENVINKATKISKTLSKTWKNMPFDQKVELQKIVFPKGTTFEKEKQRVRTPEVNLLFELTKRTTGIYENKKSGILTHNEMDSALVELGGIEPPSKQGIK